LRCYVDDAFRATERAGVLRLQNEWTPLHCAASSFELECLKLLLKRGANCDAKTLAGESPLHLAATPDLCEGDKREADAVLKALLDHDKRRRRAPKQLPRRTSTP
jgi:ankyrin repeat protein